MIKLSEIGKGALEDRFQKALTEVIINLRDLTTDEKKIREINIKIKIKPNEKRDLFAISALVTNKLAPIRELGSSVAIRISEDGELQIEEYYSDYPNQVEMKID